jgi:hypothetical protein
MQLFIGLAYYDGVKVPTMMSLIGAMRELQCPHTLIAHRGPYTHHNRNQLMRQAYDVGASHLLFVDTDVTFPPDGINRLISHGKDVVGGNYPMRGTGTSTVKLIGDDGQPTGGRLPEKLFRCWAVPTGFMLIDLEKAKAIGEPWFFFREIADEDGGLEGEDVFFCRRANESGLQVWCDPSIPMQHIVEQPMSNGR